MDVCSLLEWVLFGECIVGADDMLKVYYFYSYGTAAWLGKSNISI